MYRIGLLMPAFGFELPTWPVTDTVTRRDGTAELPGSRQQADQWWQPPVRRKHYQLLVDTQQTYDLSK